MFHLLSRPSLPAILLSVATPTLHAATFTAANLNDLVDAKPGDGKCSSIVNPPNDTTYCTLRAAIMEANATATKDTIRLIDGATYVLTLPGKNGGAEKGDLNITQPVRIETESLVPGSATRAIIDANQVDRVLNISVGDVDLFNLGITGGELLLGDGDDVGGGIRYYNQSATSLLTLSFVALYGNVDEHNPAGLYVGSGKTLIQDSQIYNNNPIAIFNSNSSVNVNTTIERSSIYGNNTAILAGKILSISNSTISGNNTGIAAGSQDNTIFIVASTIAANLQAGISTYTDKAFNVLIGNSVFANNGKNCLWYAPSAKFTLVENLYDDATCPMGGMGDKHNIPALLSPLGYYGGPTPTHRPLAGSPLIDHGNLGLCDDSQIDQRGLPRSVDFAGMDPPRCDIGSVELDPDRIFWDDFEQSL